MGTKRQERWRTQRCPGCGDELTVAPTHHSVAVLFERRSGGPWAPSAESGLMTRVGRGSGSFELHTTRCEALEERYR